VDELLRCDLPVRVLTRHPETAALPPQVQVVGGDLATPASLGSALQDVRAVFLVWTLPYATAPDVVDLLGRHARRVVFLSAPRRTPHPFFQQPNRMA
jgi:uncharacterized protein YbjT (DUF2867 family)